MSEIDNMSIELEKTVNIGPYSETFFPRSWRSCSLSVHLWGWFYTACRWIQGGLLCVEGFFSIALEWRESTAAANFHGSAAGGGMRKQSCVPICSLVLPAFFGYGQNSRQRTVSVFVALHGPAHRPNHIGKFSFILPSINFPLLFTNTWLNLVK